jgi:hypothetical protein
MRAAHDPRSFRFQASAWRASSNATIPVLTSVVEGEVNRAERPGERQPSRTPLGAQVTKQHP